MSTGGRPRFWLTACFGLAIAVLATTIGVVLAGNTRTDSTTATSVPHAAVAEAPSAEPLAAPLAALDGDQISATSAAVAGVLPVYGTDVIDAAIDEVRN